MQKYSRGFAVPKRLKSTAVDFYVAVILVIISSAVLFLIKDSVHAWSGGLDGKMVMFDFNVGKQTVVGAHNDAVRYENFGYG